MGRRRATCCPHDHLKTAAATVVVGTKVLLLVVAAKDFLHFNGFFFVNVRLFTNVVSTVLAVTASRSSIWVQARMTWLLLL